MPSSRPTLYIFDANAMLHRAWHALPPLTNPEGQVVNAVYGVVRFALRLIQDRAPDACVACWDTKAPTFRHEAYKEYKAQREKQPDELYEQIPLVQEGLETLGIPSLWLDGFEADDLLGTIATRAAADGWDVMIVTGDRDALQLIAPHISVMSFKKGVTETMIYDEVVLKAEFGLTPAQFVEYKAMRGDPSDNIPGIKGIGEKGATTLLQQYGTLKEIFKAAHDQKSELSASVRAKLLEGEPGIEDTLALVRIHTGVPITWEPKKQSFVLTDEARSFFLRMGFKSMVKEGPGAKMVREAEAKKDAESVSLSKTKKMREKTSMSGLNWQSCSTSRDLITALAKWQNASEIIAYFHAAPGSLFAQQLQDVVLLNGAEGICFPDTLLQEQMVKTAVAQVLLSAEARASHDAKAQRKTLAAHGIMIDDWQFDTMLAAYLLLAGDRAYDLSSLATRYHLEPAAITTAEEAGALLHVLVPCLKKELEREKLLPILTTYELPLIPVLARMEEHGILVDVPYLRTLATELQQDKKALEAKMEKLIGKTINPASPAQLSEVLFTDLGLPTKGIKKGKTGYSTAASELEKLRGMHPLIELIEDHRELAKMLSTYVETLPDLADKESRIHTTYNQAIAATGRLSSTDPNLQNIPIRTELGRRIRRAFVADKGYTLLSCDYSQIELRLVAAIAHDQKMLEAFREGKDIHTATASAIWNIPLAEVSKDQRRIAKAINFGIIFGQGPQGLSQVAGISYADAKQFIATYFEVYKGVQTYMTETKALAHTQGYVETLSGRRRYLPDLASQMHQLRAQAERMAINMPIQGTDADLMKRAMIEVDRLLPSFSPDSRLLLQVHDELVLEVPDSEVTKVAKTLKELMESVEKFGVPLLVEAKCGKNWAEMEPLSL